MQVDVYDPNHPNKVYYLYLDTSQKSWYYYYGDTTLNWWGSDQQCYSGFLGFGGSRKDAIFTLPIGNLDHVVAPPQNTSANGVGTTFQLSDGTYALSGSTNLEEIYPISQDYTVSHPFGSYRITNNTAATMTLLYSDTTTGGVAWFGRNRIISADTDVHQGTDTIILAPLPLELTIQPQTSGRHILTYLGDGTQSEVNYVFSGISMRPGQMLRMKAIEGSPSVSLQADTTDTSVLTVSQPNVEGQSVSVSLPPLSSTDIYFLTPNFGEGLVTAGVDRGGDGTIDETLSLQPTNIQRVYLPLVQH